MDTQRTPIDLASVGRHAGRWLVLGSGPGAASYLSQTEWDWTISANRWVNAELLKCHNIHLDFAWIYDTVAIRKYMPKYRECQQIFGTKIIGPREHAIRHNYLRHLNITANISVCLSLRTTDTLAHWGRMVDAPATSGGAMAQIAVILGATEVHYLGMEGYYPKPANPARPIVHKRRSRPIYRRSEKVERRLTQQTHDWQGPLLSDLAAKNPEIQFVWHGAPLYNLPSLNNIVVV